MALAVAFEIRSGIVNGIAFEIAFGISIGIAFGISVGIASRIAGRIVGSVTFGIAISILYGFRFGSTFGIAVVITSFICSLRAYYYPLFSWLTWPKVRGHLYRFHPVAWDDLCAAPFPAMYRLLVSHAEYAPAAGEREIERLINNYPSQRPAALQAKTILMARKAAQEKNLRKLDTYLV